MTTITIMHFFSACTSWPEVILPEWQEARQDVTGGNLHHLQRDRWDEEWAEGDAQTERQPTGTG